MPKRDDQRGPAFVYQDAKTGVRIPVYSDPARAGHFIVYCHTGKHRAIRRRAASAEAARRIAAELVEKHQDKRDPDGSRTTLQAFVNDWWTRVVVRSNLAPKTREDYRATIERYLLPEWGHYRLEDITGPLVLDMYYTLEQRYSTALANRALTKLRMVLEAARTTWRYLSYNAVDDARKNLEPHHRAEKIVLSTEETARLLATVEGHRLAALYHIALTLGLRLGELLGLQWTDIDWTARTITIRRQTQEVGGQKHTRDQAKSMAGNRVLPLPARLYDRLATLYDARPVGMFLFPNERGGQFSPTGFERHFRGGVTRRYTKKDGSPGESRIIGIRQKAGLPEGVTMHSLRHTCTTRLLELGVPEETRAKILGHGKRGITQHYSHVDLRLMRDALERLERVLLERAA